MKLKYTGVKPYKIIYKNKVTTILPNTTVELPHYIVKHIHYNKLVKLFKVIEE